MFKRKKYIKETPIVEYYSNTTHNDKTVMINLKSNGNVFIGYIDLLNNYQTKHLTIEELVKSYIDRND